MKLPSELGSLQDLKKREANAFKKSTHWHDQLDDAYEYFLPNRNLFETTMAGQKKMDKIFDSTALEAINKVLVSYKKILLLYGRVGLRLSHQEISRNFLLVVNTMLISKI